VRLPQRAPAPGIRIESKQAVFSEGVAVGEKYDPGHISRFFDEYKEREWDRLEAEAPAIVSFHLHRRYLRRYVKRGHRVLEAGAGAGRFTIEFARLGADVTVGDVSPGQLALNREKVVEVECEGRVVAWELLDITDLSRFPDGNFDGIVCYGGLELRLRSSRRRPG
jgi:ubiquinone/menaquinone biosynthesis C-methylase UbiE